MPVPLALPALPAAPSADAAATVATVANRTAVAASAAGSEVGDAAAATVETPAMTAGPAPRGPIALPGPEPGPLTPPDGLPAMTRPADGAERDASACRTAHGEPAGTGGRACAADGRIACGITGPRAV